MKSVTVYALEFDSGEIYVGLTNDPDRRLEEHRKRKSISTRRFMGTFRVIHESVFPTYEEARRHEKYLKSGAGRRLLKSARA